MMDGPELSEYVDLCSNEWFEPNTGNYYFDGRDMEEFPPGTYTFRITGYIHSKSDYTTIEMTLVDPCPPPS